MSEQERRRIRRRKKAARNVKRTFVGIVLAPGKMPRITADMVSRVMQMCELAAIMFAAVLILHLALPEIIRTFWVVIVGAVFAGLMGVILLADYQDKLAEYELYGFKI